MRDHFSPVPAADPGPLATLLDVTLRDGGFEVDFHWPREVFADVPAALLPLGVQIVELGYLGGVPLEHRVADAGIGAYLTPDLVAAARREGLRLAVMVHPTALAEPLDLKPFAAAGLDMLRLVYHPSWFDDIARIAAAAHDVGLAVSVNIALASRYAHEELLSHAMRIQTAMEPDVLYIADTCGALLPAEVTSLVGALGTMNGEVGFHAHDFLSLGYANALAAAGAGATYLDVSILGLGRGGGNLQAEIVLIRHRLAQLQPKVGDLLTFLTCRRRLADLARRPLPPLLAPVCGAGNLTPVEEHDLALFAAECNLPLDLAALWVASATPRIASRHRADLARGWLAQCGGSWDR